jgi:lysyl-tRNA synthetase, class II
MPQLAAAATAVAGLLNLGSALTADLPGRLRAVVLLAPASEIELAHALALPAGLALLGAAWQLGRRRHRALLAAVALLACIGALDILKGLDVGDAAVSWALAVVLWHGRAGFWVRHEPVTTRAALRRAIVAGAASVATATTAVAFAAGHALAPLRASQVPYAAVSLLTLTGGPRFAGHFHWLGLSLGLLGVFTAGYVAAGLLAPLRPGDAVGPIQRRRAAALIRRHGSDTLSAFKLRRDLRHLWSPDGHAMAAYREQSGVLLLAGDPVGPDGALPGLLAVVRNRGRRHGLAVGCVGASEAFADAAAAAGLRRFYLGDEAILSTGAIDLRGGAMKSLRKAVNRIARHGYVAELARVGDLDHDTAAELDRIGADWRSGAPERGFSMAHDRLVDELLPDALVVVARDADGKPRAFLHFVPVYGRPVVSLGFMRRDRDTPNGLTDFLVVEAARLLGERGIHEFSLNFAAYGRWLRAPANGLERLLAHILRVADRWFQIESLLRFNAKFRPRWQPRYLLFERRRSLPRIAWAALRAEGHVTLPAPRPPVAIRRPPAAGSRVA